MEIGCCQVRGSRCEIKKCSWWTHVGWQSINEQKLLHDLKASGHNIGHQCLKERSVKPKKIGKKNKPQLQVAREKGGILCSQWSRVWWPRAQRKENIGNQKRISYVLHTFSSQKRVESKERWFRTRRRDILQTSSIYNHTEAVIEAQRPRVQERSSKHHRSYRRQRLCFHDSLQLCSHANSHPAREDNSWCKERQWRKIMGKVAKTSSLEWSEKTKTKLLWFKKCEERRKHFISGISPISVVSNILSETRSFRKNRGRVVWRGDAVRDDSQHYAVCTEQGASASHMTAAKVLDVISRWPGCSGQASCRCIYTSGVKRRSRTAECDLRRLSYHMDKSTKIKTSKKMGLN